MGLGHQPPDALALGGIVHTQSSHFKADGTVNDDYARHEAYHTRTVATFGEFGFYVTYVIVGSLFAAAQGGPWNGLDTRGCGNPLEKHAYAYYSRYTLAPGSPEVAADTC